MEASRKVYFEEHQREQGSLFRQKLTEAQQVNGHEGAQQAGSLRSFAPRQKEFLRSLRFGHIMSGFLTLRES